MSKKKILYHSDFSLMKTGFGRNAKLVLSYLYNTGKYEIIHYCCGLNESYPDFPRTPWENIGALPLNYRDDQQDPRLSRMAAYGCLRIDGVMEEVKPDVYIAAQDIWGVDYAIDKPWFKKTNSVIWTTLDSLPLLPKAVEAADKIKNYWVWADFATQEFHKLGHEHVKTLHGAVDSVNFFKLDSKRRLKLRNRFKISKDSFVVGFVFRNQLRKSVPNLLEGYKLFKEKNPKQKSFLLLHAHFSEGWNIHRLADEYGIDKKEILTTYVCRKCGGYEVKAFSGQDKDCPICLAEKTQMTTNVQHGVTEEQLNEIYNLMDCYCHPFTSGGQELPIQEAKLTELVTLVTNYSCGEDMCVPEAHSLPLEWSPYREHGTEFIKASTSAESIEEQLTKVCSMSDEDRTEMGAKAKDWIIENYSVEKIGKQIEEYIDSAPDVDVESIYTEKDTKNPDAEIDDSLPDDEWILSLYKRILDMKVDRNDKGFLYWMQEMEAKSKPRKDIEDYFREEAKSANAAESQVGFEEILDKDDEGRRIIYVIPESAGDVYMATSLFKSLKEQYPEYNLYVACEPIYAEILDGNPYVHKVVPYLRQMESIWFLEGKGGTFLPPDRGDHKGYFEVALLSHFGTQRLINYTHNGKDKIAFNLKY